ncbi:MAG: universal stress protein [Actinomycetes bacterium]
MTTGAGQALGPRAAPARILVAVDDSPQSLRAARTAIAIAAVTSARLLVVTVVQDGVVSRALARASTEAAGVDRLHTSAEALLHHVERLATDDGVHADTVELAGEPGLEIVSEARRWAAELVVVGRCAQELRSQPVLGRVAQQVVELSEAPVLVVP